MTSLCFSDEDSCGTKKGTGPGTGSGTGTGSGPGTGPGTGLGGSPGINTDASPTATERSNKTLPIALGVGIPVFVIFWAIVAFLAIDHQKRKTVAAAGKTNGTSGLAMPVYVDTKQQMPPSV
ncbi:hypothetical protein MKW92_018669 [Papaver armeniacum]|nr:hypothetical protein MKW92_018669 [Papaver armeniacum]